MPHILDPAFRPKPQELPVMNSCITMYVPTVRGDGKPILEDLAKPWHRKVCKLFTTLFGGCTSITGRGFYCN